MRQNLTGSRDYGEIVKDQTIEDNYGVMIAPGKSVMEK